MLPLLKMTVLTLQVFTDLETHTWSGEVLIHSSYSHAKGSEGFHLSDAHFCFHRFDCLFQKALD